MRTSPMYDSTYASLRIALPEARYRPIEPFASAMVGVVVRGSSALGRIAHGMPLSTPQEGKEQRLERLVANVRIRPTIHVEPVVRNALNQVYLTEAHTGPVHVMAWWTKDAEGRPLLRAVMTNLPACWQT